MVNHSAIESLSPAPPLLAHGTLFRKKYVWESNQWRETTYLFIPSELCPKLHMFVYLKDNSESQKRRRLS